MQKVSETRLTAILKKNIKPALLDSQTLRTREIQLTVVAGVLLTSGKTCNSPSGVKNPHIQANTEKLL